MTQGIIERLHTGVLLINQINWRFFFMINLKVKGDLILAFKLDKFDGIVYGCNCFCNMGAGIAKTISKSFPSAFKADQTTDYGDRNKLGTYSKSEMLKETYDNYDLILNSLIDFNELKEEYRDLSSKVQ